MLLPRSGKVALRWQLERGTQLHYELTHSLSLELGSRGKHEQELLFGLGMEISDVNGRTAVVRATLDRIKVVMSGMASARYDSQSGEKPAADNPVAQAFSAMVGKSFTLTLEDSGRVRDVHGFADALAGVLGDRKNEGPLAHLREQLDDTGVAALLQLA